MMTMQTKKFLPTLFISLTISVIILVAVALLPDSSYTRYRLLNVGAYKLATWAYERIHFDTTPVDVVFIGTSHTMNGIDSELVEAKLNQNGGAAHVVNFAIPHFGRDMHYTLIKELLAHRKPKVIVLEVRENEARDLHPGTHYLAEPTDLINAPLVVNLRFLGNLIRLPLRTMKVNAYELFPSLFDYSPDFSMENYKGAHLNHALSWPDGKARDGIANANSLKKMTHLAKASSELEKIKYFLFHNANYTYLERIDELAKAHGVELVYAYIPSYGAPKESVFAANYPDNQWFYFDQAIWENKRHWFDAGHLNATGAKLLSDNVAFKLRELIDQSHMVENP